MSESKIIDIIDRYDRKRHPKRCQHLQNCAELWIGITALHTGNLRLLDVAHFCKLTLADSLLLPRLNKCCDNGDAQISLCNFIRREMLLIKIVIPNGKSAFSFGSCVTS